VQGSVYAPREECHGKYEPRSEQSQNFSEHEHYGCSAELCQRAYAGRPFGRVYSHIGSGLGLLELDQGLAMLCFLSLLTLVNRLLSTCFLVKLLVVEMKSTRTSPYASLGSILSSMMGMISSRPMGLSLVLANPSMLVRFPFSQVHEVPFGLSCPKDSMAWHIRQILLISHLGPNVHALATRDRQ
jgi:hypothetical protein